MPATLHAAGKHKNLINPAYIENMNKIINESVKLLEAWKQLEEEKRNYEHKSWHCVNVKRHNDYIDFNDLIKNYSEDEQEYLKNHFLNDDESIKDYIYYEDFLSWQGWDQLNYEISDIEEITKGAEDEHKKFIYLKTSYSWGKNAILALGRSGGWACFQTTEEDTAEEIESILDNITNEKREIVEEDKVELKNRLEDLKTYNEQLRGAMEEISYIKDYIKRFNKSLNFKEFLQGEIDYKLDEYRAEEDAKKDNFNDFLSLVNKNLDNILSYMKKYIQDEKLKAAIDRNLKSIKALIKNKL